MPVASSFTSDFSLIRSCLLSPFFSLSPLIISAFSVPYSHSLLPLFLPSLPCWPPAFLTDPSSYTDPLLPRLEPQAFPISLHTLIKTPPCSQFQCHFNAKDTQTPFPDLPSHLKSSCHLGTLWWIFHLYAKHHPSKSELIVFHNLTHTPSWSFWDHSASPKDSKTSNHSQLISSFDPHRRLQWKDSLFYCFFSM